MAALQLSQFGDRVHQLIDQLYLLDARGLDGEELNSFVNGIREAYARRNQGQKQAQHKLYELGIMELIAEIDVQRPKALKPDCLDLLYLHELITTHKPKLVIEYGSGWSTYVLAHALQRNKNGKLISIDGDKHWANVNTQALPSRFQDICEIRYSQPTIQVLNNQAVYIHDYMPSDIPDIVYVDGPACSSPVVPVSADALMLEERMEPGALVVVDGRHDNVLCFSQQWKRPWKAESFGLRCVDNDPLGKDLLVLNSCFTLLEGAQG